MNPKDRDELLIRLDEGTRVMKRDVGELKGDVKNIKENHLTHIQAAQEGQQRSMGWLQIAVVGLYGLLGSYVIWLVTR